MYTREEWREDSREIMIAAMHDISFAVLVSASPDGLNATHMPMLVAESDDGIVLEAHMARNNPHWRMVQNAASCVAIFKGPDSYISPSWYASKKETGKAVPTWAYVAVHAHGRADTVTDQDWLYRHVAALSERHEAGRPKPWTLSDAPADYVSVMLRGIVGIRLKVERLEGAWKLNQHRTAADLLSTIAGIEAEGDERALAIAAAMRRAGADNDRL